MTEATQGNTVMVLLDWEKAFDKISHDKLIEACRRLNILEKMVNNIAAIYKSPKFIVRDKENESGVKQQFSGIRQGCPLSPYLFLLVMTVMFADIKRKNRKLKKGNLPFFDFGEILYADDTLLIMKNYQDGTALCGKYYRRIIIL